MAESLVEASDALHARVLAFARASMAGPALPESFDQLASAIGRFQAEASPASRRLLRARGLGPDELERADQIPAVPTDAFKLTRVAVHPPALDQIVFRTSGTTQGTRGEHAMRTTATYEELSLLWGRHMLLPDQGRPVTLALAPPPEEAPDSSLNFMCRLFGERWSGGASFLLAGGHLDLDDLRRRIDRAASEARPVLLLATSFALVHLVDEIGGAELPLPPGSRVMQTGGTKGRSREVSAHELWAQVARAFALPKAAVVNEYGMTELTSQAYEAGIRSLVGEGPASPGRLEAPPWMRVVPVDPETLAPVGFGEVGIARIVDLGNVDSAVAVQTQDRVRLVEGGFELLGRLPGATPRGCSLAIEELLEARGGRAG